VPKLINDNWRQLATLHYKIDLINKDHDDLSRKAVSKLIG